MHISVDQVGEVALREDARVERYLARLDLARGAAHVAALLVGRGLVRVAGCDAAVLAAELARDGARARCAYAWVRAARATVARLAGRPRCADRWWNRLEAAAEVAEVVTVSVRRVPCSR